ncbi:sensor histidine kinase [uncultured Paludibaculum sp.]|uniref:sensor histidine kinase n=1 Tax=uncultured Paludibaculum sp. TaxID=1765020 RepID=UPI002AABAEFE|nr:sensor histidine kinase [uncultured Paludibaculum sp.]
MSSAVPRDPARHRVAWWKLSAVWVSFALFNATQVVLSVKAEMPEVPGAPLFIRAFLGWMIWAAATPLVVELGRRFPLRRPRLLVALPLHMATWISISALRAVLLVVLAAELLKYWPNEAKSSFLERLGGQFLSQLHMDLLAYAGVMIFCAWRESQQRLQEREVREAQLETQLSQAQLRALRAQLNPHFLFNTLNGISALVRDGNQSCAIRMLVGLSDLLRYVIDSPPDLEVELDEEIRFAKQYLDIQQMRYGERLGVNWSVPEDLGGARVPSLILQPLLENAIQHGVAARNAAVNIRVSAVETAGMLRLTVNNDGPSLQASPRRGGVGIANTRQRLATLYGDQAGLEVHDAQPSGVEAVIHMPLREDPA